MPSLLWLRRDLRLNDLPSLVRAHEEGPVLPVFCLDPALLANAGAVRTIILLRSLSALNESCDGALVLRTGDPEQIIPELVAQVGASSVHISAESEPYGRARDERVREALDVPLVATGTPYAVGPGSVLTGQGQPYKVFTPFARAWREHGWPGPALRPAGLRWVTGVESESLPDEPACEVQLPAAGEPAALARWAQFLEEDLPRYADERDRPDLDTTSQLSMHLKFGTIHPRTLLADMAASPQAAGRGAQVFSNELAWREFHADVLWHRPDSLWSDLRAVMSGMVYDDPDSDPQAAAALQAWKQGRTGFPIVDAGMRQLRAEGWMHNRVRMVAASFLVKDLHVRWQYGAAHFMEYLRDGDPASNNHNWQWVAGTGTDAAPYFRIFNPTTQGKKFDPHGEYVRRYVPELRHLAGAACHEPGASTPNLTCDYPAPIVDHAQARRDALARHREAVQD
ncbi:cryptochrome/photolyase family protein [Gephyromycinifex aptenodytis]|uniref:cryptochrome/photolyase family protein n=1 Tax=Gephyromycinifex aptenodytis TaxID=2716227 RepID=UPI0014475ED5|nr:deoxyribodipyrimidine photo-lyase [Gephyromycinifex aptenodytis]